MNDDVDDNIEVVSEEKKENGKYNNKYDDVDGDMQDTIDGNGKKSEGECGSDENKGKEGQDLLSEDELKSNGKMISKCNKSKNKE